MSRQEEPSCGCPESSQETHGKTQRQHTFPQQIPKLLPSCDLDQRHCWPHIPHLAPWVAGLSPKKNADNGHFGHSTIFVKKSIQGAMEENRVACRSSPAGTSPHIKERRWVMKSRLVDISVPGYRKSSINRFHHFILWLVTMEPDLI